MALIIVLWLIVLMSVIAAGHSRNAHVETRLAARHVDAAAARQVAAAAVELAILELLEGSDTGRIPATGEAVTLPVLQRDAIVSARPASGLVDLNLAEPALLARLFTAAGAADATALADAVLDWRDRDELARLHGAEDDDYRSAGLAWTARDDAFTGVDELRYVFGMTDAVFRAVAPYVTVHSDAGAVDLDVAPPALVDMLAGRTGAAPLRRPGGDGVYHVNVAVPGRDGVLVSSEAVVRLDRTGERPYLILAWREHSRLFAADIDEARP